MLFAVDEAVLQHLGIAGEDVFAVHGPQELGVEDDLKLSDIMRLPDLFTVVHVLKCYG